MITNPGWMTEINSQIIWLHSSNNLKILLVILLVIALCFCQLMLLSPPHQLLHDKKSIFCHKDYFFYFLLPEVSDSKTWEDTSPQHFHQGGKEGALILPPIFCMIQSQSSVIKFSSFIFLLPKVSDNKPGVDEENKPSNNFGYIRPIVKRYCWLFCWLMLLSPPHALIFA